MISSLSRDNFRLEVPAFLFLIRGLYVIGGLFLLLPRGSCYLIQALYNLMKFRALRTAGMKRGEW